MLSNWGSGSKVLGCSPKSFVSRLLFFSLAALYADFLWEFSKGTKHMKNLFGKSCKLRYSWIEYFHLALSLWQPSQVVLRIWKSTCLRANMENYKTPLAKGRCLSPNRGRFPMQRKARDILKVRCVFIPHTSMNSHSYSSKGSWSVDLWDHQEDLKHALIGTLIGNSVFNLLFGCLG